MEGFTGYIFYFLLFVGIFVTLFNSSFGESDREADLKEWEEGLDRQFYTDQLEERYDSK